MLSSKEKRDQEIPSSCAPLFLMEKQKGFLKEKINTHTFHKTAITFWGHFLMKLLIAECKNIKNS